MTLSSVNEGFVLLRNLWEYNSILKYRYKKRKAYKVATMKHLPAPLAKEYKPNLAVRILKATFSHFRDGLQGIGSLVSGESNNDGWIRFEPKLMDIQTIRQPQVDFKFWEGKLGVTITYDYNSLGNFYNYVELKSLDNMFIERSQHVPISEVENVIQLMYVKLAKNMANYNVPKQEIRERKLTHVRYLLFGGGIYFTKHKVYKVVETKIYKDGSWYVQFETDVEGEPHCRFFRDCKGVNEYENEFELIYDNNYENN